MRWPWFLSILSHCSLKNCSAPIIQIFKCRDKWQKYKAWPRMSVRINAFFFNYDSFSLITYLWCKIIFLIYKKNVYFIYISFLCRIYKQNYLLDNSNNWKIVLMKKYFGMSILRNELVKIDYCGQMCVNLLFQYASPLSEK